MNLPEKPPTHFDRQPANIRRIGSRTLRLAILAALSGILLCSPIGSPVLAKAAHQADAAPAIDPDAMEALKKMGAYLRSLKSFQVEGDVTSDDVLQDGQIVQNASKVTLLAAKPNRLRAEIISDEKAKAIPLRRQKLHRLRKARQLLRNGPRSPHHPQNSSLPSMKNTASHFPSLISSNGEPMKPISKKSHRLSISDQPR